MLRPIQFSCRCRSTMRFCIRTWHQRTTHYTLSRIHTLAYTSPPNCVCAYAGRRRSTIRGRTRSASGPRSSKTPWRPHSHLCEVLLVVGSRSVVIPRPHLGPMHRDFSARGERAHGRMARAGIVWCLPMPPMGRVVIGRASGLPGTF